jgi:peptidoglycan/LPS O-acetylase OafA/YrhL
MSLVEVPKPTKLLHLDGLRGLAALYVFAVHLYSDTTHHPLLGGQWAVVVFIVLSGYCLTLPVGKDGVLRGGFRGFIARRARRILPAYYAALLLSWTMGFHASAAAVISHIFLVHNLSRSWIYALDGSAWSLATEWQIYFVFALVLLPVLARYGRAMTLVAALALAGMFFCLDDSLLLACPHFLFCFALGMAATWMRPARWQTPVSVALFAVVIAVSEAMPAWENGHIPLMDVAVALCAMLLLAGMARDGLASRLFSLRPLVALGAFSYSLYLIHGPIVLRMVTFAPWPLTVFVVLVLAYIFHLVFERPFLASRPTQRFAFRPAPADPSSSTDRLPAASRESSAPR